MKGQYFFRDVYDPNEEDLNMRTKYGDHLMMIVGIIILPESEYNMFKGEHRYNVEDWVPLPFTGLDLTKQARGLDLGSMITERVWGSRDV